MKKSDLLPDNPTQFDYFHAIRAAAARNLDHKLIYELADEGMNLPDNNKKILKECLSAMPCSYIPNHTIENLPAMIECLSKRLVDSESELEARMMAKPNPDCLCKKCNPNAWWMVVCKVCGNKRCPHATDHGFKCTHSNEPNQKGEPY